jgi:hypothetical protein
MHGLNCSQFKTPPDYFYAGLRVLLIDIIQVDFCDLQCGGGLFCSYKARVGVLVLVIYPVFIRVLSDFSRRAHRRWTLGMKAGVDGFKVGCHTSWALFQSTQRPCWAGC